MNSSGTVVASSCGGGKAGPTSSWRGRGTRLGLAFGLGLALASVAAPARADDPPPVAESAAAEARQQYGMGTQAFAQKRYSEAALHFEAAASFKASAIALYTAALAWDLASRPERAADAYARSLEVPGLDPKQTTIAKDRVSALEKTLGTVAVTAPEGWKVQLDTLTEVQTPARLHGSPGVHTLTVRIPGKPIERRDVTLDAGKVTTLELEEPPPAPVAEPEPASTAPEPPPAPPARLREPFWTTLRVVGVGVAGVGVAALGAGVILGTSANGAKDAYDAGPTRAAFDHASSLQTWTNVTLITGAVLVAGGVALVVLPLGNERSEGQVKVGAAPGSIVVGGTF